MFSVPGMAYKVPRERTFAVPGMFAERFRVSCERSLVLQVRSKQ